MPKYSVASIRSTAHVAHAKPRRRTSFQPVWPPIVAQVNTTRPNVDRLATQNEHRSPRNGARFLCFRKKGPIAVVAMRREWRAAGRGGAQVREGAETSPQRVGAAWAVCGKNAGAARDREGGEKAAAHLVEKTRGQPERGVGWWGVAWTACGNERQVRPEASQARHQDRERAAQSAQMPRTT